MKANQNEESICYCLFSHLQERQAPSHVTVTWEKSMPKAQNVFPASLTQLLLLSMMSSAVGYPFVSLGQVAWLSPLGPSFEPPTYSLAARAAVEAPVGSS